MTNESNQHRIKFIYRMLLEMATGNLNFRIPMEDSDLQFNELAATLNDLAEKLQHYGIHPPNFKNAVNNETTTSIIQKVQEYILNHLEEPLPSTNELSRIFGTNEFTLKENFRDVLNTSIYQFYNDERLKRAHYLIEQTNVPLKEIAFICGFNDYNNFSKAFKKKFNYSPSDINRIT